MRATSQIPTSNPCVSKPSQPGSSGQVEVAEERVGGDLEKGVEDDEHRRALPVAERDVVPDEHHRDAAGKPDDDHSCPVGRLVGEEDPSEREHERRPDDPGEEERGAEEASVPDPVVAHPAEILVADLREDRVHHHQQAQCDGQGDRADLELVEPLVQARQRRAEQKTGRHGQRDPEREEAVEPRELPHHPRRRGRGRRRGRHRSGSGFSRRHRTGPRSVRPPRAGAPRRADGGRRAARGRRSSRCVVPRSRPGSSPPPSAP